MVRSAAEHASSVAQGRSLSEGSCVTACLDGSVDRGLGAEPPEIERCASRRQLAARGASSRKDWMGLRGVATTGAAIAGLRELTVAHGATRGRAVATTAAAAIRRVANLGTGVGVRHRYAGLHAGTHTQVLEGC